MYFRNVIDFQQTTLRYIPKDKALQFQKWIVLFTAIFASIVLTKMHFI
jgi:hypothetical protein